MHNKKKILALLEQKKYADAHIVCDRSIEEDENNYQAIFDKSKIYAREKNWRKAFLYVDKAISIMGEPAFFHRKGQWLIDTGFYEESIPVLSEGIEIERDCNSKYYRQTLYFLKAYAELQLNYKKDCANSLLHVSDDYSSWLNGGLQSKKEIQRQLS